MLDNYIIVVLYNKSNFSKLQQIIENINNSIQQSNVNVDFESQIIVEGEDFVDNKDADRKEDFIENAFVAKRDDSK